MSKLVLRLPDEVHVMIKVLADVHQFSINQEILLACQERIGRFIVMNESLVNAIRDEIAQSRSEGLDESDIKWMSVGAGIRLAREQGIIGESVSDEMAAAISEVVKQELAKK